MKKRLLLLPLGILAAALPGYVIADSGLGLTIAAQAPAYAPATLPAAAALHPATTLLPASALTAAPVWRERNDWEKRRTDQWSELEWQRQQWRENHGDATPIDVAPARGPISVTSF